MNAILDFLEFILLSLLGIVEFVIIANAVMSWLIAFNIVNMRHPVVAQIARGLDAVTRPVLRPIQKMIPSMGGLDISPLIVILVIEGARGYLIPPLFAWLHTVLGGPVGV